MLLWSNILGIKSLKNVCLQRVLAILTKNANINFVDLRLLSKAASLYFLRPPDIRFINKSAGIYLQTKGQTERG